MAEHIETRSRTRTQSGTNSSESSRKSFHKLQNSLSNCIRYIGLRTQVPYPSVPNLESFPSYDEYITSYEKWVKVIPFIDEINEKRIRNDAAPVNNQNVVYSEFVQRRIKRNQERRARKGLLNIVRLPVVPKEIAFVASSDTVYANPGLPAETSVVVDPVILNVSNTLEHVGRLISSSQESLRQSTLELKRMKTRPDAKAKYFEEKRRKDEELRAQNETNKRKTQSAREEENASRENKRQRHFEEYERTKKNREEEREKQRAADKQKFSSVFREFSNLNEDYKKRRTIHVERVEQLTNNLLDKTSKCCTCSMRYTEIVARSSKISSSFVVPCVRGRRFHLLTSKVEE